MTGVAPRRKTRTVIVGGVPIGSEHPIVIQSMLKTPAEQIDAAVRETEGLAQAGCGIIRVAVLNAEAINHIAAFVKRSPLPVVADIHFDPKLALAAIEAGVAKIRLNPGNLKDKDAIRRIVSECSKRGIPIRVGANSGSIKRRDGSDDRSIVEALVSEVVGYCEYIESLGFHDIVVSLKASDVYTNLVVYRAVARLSDYPLHLGLTATGHVDDGIMKSSIALGSLMLDGIGDTIRVSLTAPPVREVETAKDILRSIGVLRDRPEVISCPTCGRCSEDIAGAVATVKAALSGVRKPLRVAVMGCVVNGPGEATECDYGVACGRGSAVLFVRGKPIKTIPSADMAEALLNLIQKEENNEAEP